MEQGFLKVCIELYTGVSVFKTKKAFLNQLQMSDSLCVLLANLSYHTVSNESMGVVLCLMNNIILAGGL